MRLPAFREATIHDEQNASVQRGLSPTAARWAAMTVRHSRGLMTLTNLETIVARVGRQPPLAIIASMARQHAWCRRQWRCASRGPLPRATVAVHPFATFALSSVSLPSCRRGKHKAVKSWLSGQSRRRQYRREGPSRLFAQGSRRRISVDVSFGVL